MALFLVRQVADHGIAIPAPTNQGYTDISAYPAATQNAINQITQLGISKGTSSSTFSPNDGVTRWQMALFIYRAGLAAGVTFNSNTGHNEFGDIAALSAEAQTAINALADTRTDPEGHIALGTGLSAFSPNLVLVRWQMALFLTRLLAADNIAAPSGTRVVVTPSATVTQAGGTGRTYTATFKNADGTPYTGAVGVRLFITSSSGVIEWDGVPAADDTTFEAPTDGLAGTGTTLLEGFPGADGVVSFTVRHDGDPAERVVPVAWEDLDNDNSAEITGNNPPTEPFGVGGQVAFTAAAATECDEGAFSGDVVAVADKDGDRIQATGGSPSPCSLYYDSGDLFRIEGAPTDLAGFEAALNAGDIVGGTYDQTVADQSTFDITSDSDASLTVTSPAAATSVDANTFTITGTAVPGYTVRVYLDDADGDGGGDATDDNETLDAGPPAEPLANSTVAAADGTWSLQVNLIQGIQNFFIATQRSAPAAADGPYVDVPTITEGAAAGARLAASQWWDFAAPTDGLNPTDQIVLNFNETVTAPTVGDTIELSDVDFTQVRLTCGTEATCTLTGTATITVTVNLFPQILAAGGTPGLQSPAQINVLGGFVGTDGLAVDVPNSPPANRQLTETSD